MYTRKWLLCSLLCCALVVGYQLISAHYKLTTPTVHAVATVQGNILAVRGCSANLLLHSAGH